MTVPIFITENGTPANGSLVDGIIHDDDRIRYVSAFLRRAIDAHLAGLGVEGYFLWSLLDNDQWTAGYTGRYGIIDVDSSGSFDRTYKKSAHWFRDLAHQRRLEVEDL